MKKQFKINKFFKTDKEDKAGLYITIIFHLVLIIVLLLYSINYQVKKETSFVLDFTKYEELEKQKKQEELEKSVSDEIDRMLSEVRKGKTPRNVAIDVSDRKLKDDRHANPDEVYDQAEQLQQKLEESRRRALQEENSDDDVSVYKEQKKEKKGKQSNVPSVLSYSLDGRKGINIYETIPAYKCYGGGDVSVSIIVNRRGYVIGTKIIEGVSSGDECLREYALEAAGRTRFERKNDAPERHVGTITYRFVAQ